MTATFASEKLRDFTESLTDLKVRLRLALAGELAQLVAQAVGEVVRTLVAGRSSGIPRSSYASDSGREVDRWGEDEDEDDAFDDSERDTIDDPRPETETGPPACAVAAPIAIAAGIRVANWWLGRRGSLITALGAGLGIGLLGLGASALSPGLIATFMTMMDFLTVSDILGVHSPV